MGFSLSWLAVKGKPSEWVREELGFRPTGQREEIPEAGFSAAEMPSGWYLIVADHKEQVASDSVLRRLSDSGCELVTCFVEEHVMASQATGWREGRRTWLVYHDSQQGTQHLDVEGEPPEGFAAIRDGLFAKQTGGGCDYIFDIPVETARSLTGYRYDQDIPGLSGEVFEVLTEIPPVNPVKNSTAGPPDPASHEKPSFFRRLFGR